jgi:hypothetical protein
MTNYSQANQDIFVLEVFDHKKNGTFLDLGCNDPTNISNTFLLESEYGWNGSCYDIDENFIKRFQGKRNCHFGIKDCTNLQLSDFQNSYYDYLSLDLEPASITLKCLQNMPFNSIEFGAITYEHDEYRFGSKIKNESRKIFLDHGFTLLCSDVHHHHAGIDYNFEDWYINTKYVSWEKVKHLQSDGLNHLQLKAKFRGQ